MTMKPLVRCLRGRLRFPVTSYGHLRSTQPLQLRCFGTLSSAPGFSHGMVTSSACKDFFATQQSSIRNSLPTVTLQFVRQFSGEVETGVRVPSMGDSITEGSVLEWKKQVGDYVEADSVVASIETDKVAVDVNTPVSGKIVRLNAEPGGVVKVGDLLFVVDTSAQPEVSSSSPSPLAATEETPKVVVSTPSPSSSAAQTTPSVPKSSGSTPPVSAATSSPPRLSTDGRVEKRVAMTRMRKRIAERLKMAQNTAAMLTTFNECDMSALMALRSQMNEQFQATHGVKLGFVSAFALASSLSLMKTPAVNAFIDGDDIIYRDYVDISVAVATPSGLLVPIIRDCQKKSWADLEKDLARLSVLAREGKVSVEDMVGGSFTISNGGVFGSMLGTPLLNPPQSSILGMHTITSRPVVRNGQIVIRPIMYLALTYDHRIVDGREAVNFLCSIRDYIEKPETMLLQL